MCGDAAKNAAERSRPVYVFFFSSRRRHTRFDCDWSSDVCSSDLKSVYPARSPAGAFSVITETSITTENNTTKAKMTRIEEIGNPRLQIPDFKQIGRASCRERV